MKPGGQGGWFTSVDTAVQQAKEEIARERSERERAERAARAARAKRRGVSFCKVTGSWRAQVKTMGKQHQLGYYNDEEMAAKAYDMAVIKIRGKHAVTNFPAEEYAEEMRSRGASEISVEKFILQLRSEAKRQNKLRREAKEDKPKRAMTGYLLFADHMRDRVKEDLTADLAEGENLNVQAMVSAIAALWREQDKETKEEWQARAKERRDAVDQRPERAAVEVGPSTSRGGKAVEVDRPGPSKRPRHDPPVQREPLPQKRGRPGRKNRSSLYRGVTLNKHTGWWEARMSRAKGYQRHFLGYYKDEEMAAKAYDMAAIKIWGKDANTNFAPEEYAEEMRSRGASEISAEKFILQLRSEAKRKPKEDKPKRAKTGYILFADHVRDRVKEDLTADLAEGEKHYGQAMLSAIAALWREQDKETKEEWLARAKGLRDAVDQRPERAAVEFHGTDDTILYPSCFDANAGLFEVLLTNEDAVLSDELNHASIIDGIRLCKAERHRYKHLDMRDLEDRLIATQTKRQRLIATDGVFSMDGHVAPLKDIVALANKYNALVFVDECHATGFLGKTGRGTEE
ncbi:2-amino-3-ketobutyrate coenzyme A ligase [Chloropicon roscoffensis]|uniref:2-amino-3-ketobutyrate coenzyme A ligase n=1 Tax=Chloropicon roscoffensis TaxID=1461544 RepID=A0AAX4PC14_9CHLO